MMVHCIIRSHNQEYKITPTNEDAEGMCTSVASLEPDPRYSGCCANIFRRGRVVRDLVVGSLTVLGVAVIIAVVFVVCFFLIPDKSGAKTPQLGEEGAFHGAPFDKNPHYGINEVEFNNSTRYEVDPQLEKTKKGGNDPHVDNHEKQESHDHSHDHVDHAHEGHNEHHHVGPVPEAESKPEPEPESEPEPEPTAEPEPEPEVEATAEPEPESNHTHGNGPVSHDHTHPDMDHNHTHPAVDHEHVHEKGQVTHDHTHPDMDHDHTHPESDHDHTHPEHTLEEGPMTHNHTRPEMDHNHTHPEMDHNHTHPEMDHDHTHPEMDHNHTHPESDHDHTTDHEQTHELGPVTHDHSHPKMDHDHTHPPMDHDHTHPVMDHTHTHPEMGHDHTHEQGQVAHDHKHPAMDHDLTHPGMMDHDHTHPADSTTKATDTEMQNIPGTSKSEVTLVPTTDSTKEREEGSLPPLLEPFSTKSPAKEQAHEGSEGTLNELVIPQDHFTEETHQAAEGHPEATGSVPVAGRHETPLGKCQPRQLEMCSDLPHALTAYPNWAGDQTEEDLHQTSLPFLRDVIVRSRCSPRAKEYSCAILEPPCTPEGTILPPCRTFCKSVASTCQEFITSRFSLSSAFDCEKFPDSSDPNVCFDMTNGSVPADNTTTVTPTTDEAEGTEAALPETTTLLLEAETIIATQCPELQCLDGTCISLSQVNDGVVDCPEGIDEEDFGGLL